MKSYQVVKSQILKKLQDGGFKPGDKVDPFRKIAKAAHASIFTVSRAVNELVAEGRLAGSTSGRYYYVNESTRTEEAARNSTLGVLLGCTSGAQLKLALSPDLREMLIPIQDGAMRQERAVLFLGSRVHVEGQSAYLPVENVVARHLNGLIVMMIYEPAYLLSLTTAQKALVVLDMDTSDLGLDSASFDNLGSAAQMVRHLVQSGARRIVFLKAPFADARSSSSRAWNYDPSVRERFDGWRAGMIAAGLPAGDDLICELSARTPEAVREGIKRLMDAGTQPDAILTEFPKITVETLLCLGVQSPKCRVAGWMAAHTSKEARQGIDLLAICDFRELGRVGAEILDARMRDANILLQRRLVPTPLSFS